MKIHLREREGKMNDEHIKLVAKIQHFYERLLAKNHEIIETSMMNATSDKKAAIDKSEALNEVMDEYEKAFESFLYKGSNDKKS